MQNENGRTASFEVYPFTLIMITEMNYFLFFSMSSTLNMYIYESLI